MISKSQILMLGRGRGSVALQNADHMLALRLNRANGQWGDYWNLDKVAA